MSKQQRKESSIYNLRIFHNWIKRQLITQACDILKENNDMDINLLDLAVGKGGDLSKWIDNGIKEVIGFDINNESIYNKGGVIYRYRPLANKHRDLRYEFYVADLSDKKSIEFVRNKTKNRKFSIVSCQFAIHYFFKNDDTLETFVQIVGNHIKDDGVFIATTVNGSLVNEMTKTKNIIGNDLFSIEKSTTNKYIVKLGKQDDEGHYFVDKPSEEYIVDMEKLKKVCSKYNLMFIGITPFNQWYDDYIKIQPDTLLSDDEQEYSFLNMSFMFMKKV